MPWQPFFSLVGTAPATLLGLVFIAASIAAAIPNEKLGPMENRNVWFLPILYEFMRVLLVCAIGTFPKESAFVFGAVLLVFGSLDLARMGWVVRGLIRHQRSAERLAATDWLWYIVYPLAATLLVWAGGFVFARGDAFGMCLRRHSRISRRRHSQRLVAC